MATNGTEVGETQVEAVRRTCRYIEANLETPLTLTALGEHAGISPAHLQRLFKRVTGITPREYADARRLGRLKSRLKERRTVTMALFEAGYGSTSRLYERASGQLGMTPAAYQRGGRRRQDSLHARFLPAGPAAAGGDRARRVQRLHRRRRTRRSKPRCGPSTPPRRSAATTPDSTRGPTTCSVISTVGCRT